MYRGFKIVGEEAVMGMSGLREISLVPCEGTTLAFEDATFEVTSQADEVTVARDHTNYAVLTEASESIPYESTVSSKVAVNERKVGEIDYTPYFVVQWVDDLGLPTLSFQRTPRRIERRYQPGQAIELGIESISRYQIVYRDGVEANFVRSSLDRFDFSFSTGFYGSCWKEPDGSCTIRFRGDRMKPAEEAYGSQSKFIVSRSKYSGNLLLILQDAATVTVS
jgi:hypothetical protein